ncbi:MAG: sorbosone dehydrogenase family protein [Bacteriovoracaceae bacterium]
MKWAILLFILTQTSFAADWFEQLQMPKGFHLKKYADVPGARQMALSASGNLYVGTMDQGQVSVVTPDGKTSLLFSGLNNPQGVLIKDNDLYIAEIHRISKVIGIDKNLKKPRMSLVRSFPEDKWHGWKTINEGPDGKLYVPIGAPCNVCEKPLPYMALHRMDFEGKNLEMVAHGIRNTVGFTWHPQTKLLYFTEMGRDMMGDNIPPDELNVITHIGENFGFPYIHGKKVKDPQFKAPKNFKFTPPILEIQAHSAPIGIAFFPLSYPKEFHNCFLIAEHGSWNRSKKSGHQISKGCLKDGKVISYSPFITGFKREEEALGRPVHILFKKDGSFFISDDHAGKVFLVQFK